jgi:hypothetical protein
MKKILFVTLIFFIAIACKKTTPNINSNTTAQTISSTKWELRKSEGSMAGNMNYLPGNGINIEFYSIDSFKTANPISSIISRDSGTYTITNTNTSGDFYLKRNFINNRFPFSQTDSIRFVGNQLIFLAHNGWADDPTLYYEKQ